MTTHKLALGFLFAGAVQLATVTAADAADPLAICQDGVPFAWANGGADIPFNPDGGSLGPLDNAGAVAQVETSFRFWQNIRSATATYTNAGQIREVLADGTLGDPIDVDITNFGIFLNAVQPDGQSAIVFDDSGEIFDLLFGNGTGILGFAGPEFIDFSNCTVLEGLSFLNGPSFGDTEAATDVMVHEFGHYSNLAHVQLNGAIALALDPTGPDPDNATFPIVFPDAFFTDDILETMYPFYFGPGLGTQTPHRDDQSSLSAIYPQPDYASTTLTISGSVVAPNGATRLSGVNVIARNLNAPFTDAVSAISGGFTDSTDPNSSDVVGTFTLTGLTPGEEYAVFVDDLGPTVAQNGAFSTGAIALPGPEEFWNGANESANGATDDPLEFEAISANTSGVDIIFNGPQPGDPLEVGDDGFVELFLDFPFDFCGVRHESLFVNANGNISFVAPSTDFTESTSELLSEVPRIAGLWDDLNPNSAGVVTFDKTDHSFTIIWEEVPEFFSTGANSFEIKLIRKGPFLEFLGPVLGNFFKLNYGDVSALDGLAGYSCGANGTSGFEHETRNLNSPIARFFDRRQRAAKFEEFTNNGNEDEVVNLSNERIIFFGVEALGDTLEDKDDDSDSSSSSSSAGDNDNIANATRIRLPFDSAGAVTNVAPAGDDVDFFKFSVEAGDIIAMEVVRTFNANPVLGVDTVLGVFDADTGDLLFVDDDGGDTGGTGFGGLSRAILQFNVDLNVAVAISTFPDLGFTGANGGAGRYVLSVRRYQGEVLPIGDDENVEVEIPNGFPFQGEIRDTMIVNSNGNIVFGVPDGGIFPGAFESVALLLSGSPRIATLWDDLDPRNGLVLVENGARSTSVHFVSVGQFGSNSPNYFSVELDKRGTVDMDYGATARGDGLVGISEGGGAEDPGPTNLSRSRRLRANGTTYENFPSVGGAVTGVSAFDLFFDDLRFRKHYY